MDAHPISVALIASTFALLAAGCANQNSIFRVTDTDPNKTETILIDAKQRPITVNTNKDKQKTCLARSADALSQAAASGNLKITQKAGGSGELGFADNETVSSIAFRTQVTEAQQEFLYYLCQLNANGVLPDGDVADNLKHFQNTMLAMVAIDDLAAAGKANASAAKPKTDSTKPAATESDKVKAAQSKAEEAQKTQDKARGTVDGELAKLWLADTPKDADPLATQFSANLKKYNTEFGQFMSAVSELQKAIQSDKGESSNAPDDVSKASTALTGAAKEVVAQYTKVSKQLASMIQEQDPKKFGAAKDTALSDFYDYRKATDAASARAETLQNSLTAWVKAKDDSKAAQDGKDAGGSESSGASSVAVAQAVTTIVQTIVWQSYIGEKCQAALFTNFAATEVSVRDFCIQHLKDADTYRFLALERNGGAPSMLGVTAPIQPLDLIQLKDLLQQMQKTQ